MAEWCEQMSVGVPALDADHQCILRIINLLDDLGDEDPRRVVETVLETLVVYCRHHFGREEQVMAGCGFPGLEFHRAEHEGFARFVSRLWQRHATRADAGVTGALRDYLTRWLYHHILIQDMAYKPYVLAAAEAGTLPDLAGHAVPPIEALGHQ